MANTQRNFIKGVMNKSIDERLLPNGQYVDALNVRLGSTEDSEIGSVENSKGNTKLTELQYNGDPLSIDARCIGAYEDGGNETLYWFIHDSNFTPSPTGKLDLIVSLNVQTNILTYIVTSIDDGGGVNTTLNFNPQYLITGVTLVDEKLLFFTDDINPPRFINAKRNYGTPVANVDAFSAESLLVIKKPPLTSPTITPQITSSQNNFIEDRFICFGYRYKYADGEYSATSQFSEPAFIPGAFDYSFGTGLNEGMLNSAQQVRIDYMSGGPLVVGVDLLWKDMTNGIIRVIEKLDKLQLGLVDNTSYDYTFSNSKIYTVLPSSEILRLYDNVPRLAKAQTIMGNRLFYGNYLEQYDLIDALGQATRLDYFVSKVSEDVGLELLTETFSQGIYYFDSGNPALPIDDSIVNFNLQGIDLVAGASFEFTLQFKHSQFTGTSPFPTSITPPTTISFQYILPRDFSSPSDLANSTDFVESVGLIGVSVLPVPSSCNGTSLTDVFNCSIPDTLLPAYTKLNSGIGTSSTQGDINISSTPTSIGFQLVSMYFEDTTNAAIQAYEFYKVVSAEGIYQKFAAPKSLHSNRSYEVGIIYMDEFNRATTALVSQNNTIHVPCSDASTANYISVIIPPSQVAPAWATRYKFCIKADKEDYFNVYSSFFFRDPETANDYFLLEGQNAQKVDEGDILLVKVDTSGPLRRCAYATVLEKQAQTKNFIEFADITIPQGVYMKIKSNDFSTASQDNSTIDYGIKSEQGTGCKDISYLVSIEDPAIPNTYLPYDIPAGSRIRMYIDNLREGKGNTIRREWFVDTTFVSPIDYPDFKSWFEGQNIPAALAAQATEDNCNGPNYANALLPCLAGSISCMIYTDPISNRVGFVVRSSQGKVGVSKKNVSLRVGIVVERAPSLMVFETEPQDALPDVWHESSESFPIVTESGMCSFFLRVAATEPTPIQFDYIDINGLPQSVIVPNDGTTVRDGLIPFVGVCSSIVTSPSTPPVDPLAVEAIKTTLSIGTHIGNRFPVFSQAEIRTDFFNCYAFGNGVESYAIRDAIGKRDLSLGNRVTSTSAQDYQEIRRFADLTYSGVFNDESNVNKLNEFNLGLLNFKPLEESYGPIYIIDGRETDILTLQEDKVSYVLQGKNILTDSVGGGQVASIPEVLGQQVARIEEYGISFHPESYSKWGPNKFFTDAKRGAVIQLRGAGTSESLSVISELGMRSWFRDLFLESFNTQKLGGFDPYMNEYVLSSNSELLPSVVECIECGISRSLVVEDREATIFCVDVGFLVGDVSIEYNVLGTGQSPFQIESTYNSVVDTTGVTSVSGTLTVDKDSVAANILNISITSEDSTHLEITVNCPDAQQITIIQVCHSIDDDAGLFIHNEYNWQDGVYISPIHSEQVELLSGTANPLISQYTQIIGPQGSGFIPADGATVRIVTNKVGAIDDYIFDPSIDELRYLRSNTLYVNTPAQMQTLFNASTNATPLVTSNGGNTYTAEFTMPSSTDEYLYLIYNYRRPTELELCYDASSDFAVCCECDFSVTTASLIFDGISEQIEIPSDASLQFGGAFTMSFWIYGTGNYIRNKTIAEKPGEWAIKGNNSTQLYIRIYTDASNYLEGRLTSANPELQWNNYIVSYDGVSTFDIFRNNDGLGGTTNTEVGTFTGITPDVNPLTIGDNTAANFSYFSLWNRELTNAEKIELYNSGALLDIASLSFSGDCISWYRLDQTNDLTTTDGVADEIGSNEGTALNMTAANIDSTNYPT